MSAEDGEKYIELRTLHSELNTLNEKDLFAYTVALVTAFAIDIAGEVEVMRDEMRRDDGQ